MSNRLFSKINTNSYSDINNKKSYNCINKKLTNNNFFGLYLHQKKNYIKYSYFKDICNLAPINIIQAKNSYKCNMNNNTEQICKSPQLYPYGFYLCDNINCNTCIPNNKYKITYDDSTNEYKTINNYIYEHF